MCGLDCGWHRPTVDDPDDHDTATDDDHASSSDPDEPADDDNDKDTPHDAAIDDDHDAANLSEPAGGRQNMSDHAMKWVAAAIVVCVAVFAWAVHDLTTTWNESLRLPEEDD